MSPSSPVPLAIARPALAAPLGRLLEQRIRLNGPISFRDWMDACLYHPEHGYYQRGQTTIGRNGDFLTSPEVHPLFGTAIGYLATELYRQLGQPTTFRIAEVGPGTGALAEVMLSHLRASDPQINAALSYTLVERDPAAAAAQQERIASLADVEIVVDLADLEPVFHLVVANELLDALPVHLLQRRNECWQELCIDYAPDRGFYRVADEICDRHLLDPLGKINPVEGQIAEVAPGRSEVVSALASSLGERALLLLFDYGYRRDRLYASWRRDGTLMTFRRHVPGDDPLAHPGEQDITAHIDIDQVEETATAARLQPLPSLNQAEWLYNLGATALPAVADAGDDAHAYLAARRAVETLTDPAGLGRIAVMGFARGKLAPLPGWENA